MSRKLSRSVHPRRKHHLSENQPLPEQVDELIPLSYNPFGEKIDTFSLSDLERHLPTTQSGTDSQPTEDFIHYDSYYERNDTSDGSNVWDEYWFPSESESSDLSQSAASFMSWSDEVEVETTKKLQRFYDALESFMYDEIPAPEDIRPELLEECLAWKSKFPHLRVVGKAIVPPGDFRAESDLRIAEEIFAEDHSDSDDETIQGSPEPFLELYETDRFIYDDVTLGTRCETDRSSLHGKIKERVADSLVQHVAETLGNRRDTDENRAETENRREGSVRERSSTSRWDRGDEEERTRDLDAIEKRESSPWRKRTVGDSSPRVGDRRSTTAASTKSELTLTPRVANSSSSSRLVLRAPVSVVFEPVETRAYHSAAIRVQSKAGPARRLHSFGGRGAKPTSFPSRQDAILRELRETRTRLSGNGTRNGTGDGTVPERPRNKTWSGGRHNVLPPLGPRNDKHEKLKSSTTTLSPIMIEVSGTKLTRSEPNDTSLRKYSLLGAKAKPEERKVGRL